MQGIRLGVGLSVSVIVVEQLLTLGYTVFGIVCGEFASEVVSVVLLKYPSSVLLESMIIAGFLTTSAYVLIIKSAD